MQKFKAVTWSHIRKAVVVATLLRAVWEFNNVDLLYTMTAGGPANSTTTLPLYVAQTAIHDQNFGYGSALTVAAFLLLTFASLAYCASARRTSRRASEPRHPRRRPAVPGDTPPRRRPTAVAPAAEAAFRGRPPRAVGAAGPVPAVHDRAAYWMVSSPSDRPGRRRSLPWPVTLEHFRTVWEGSGFGIYFRNSIIVAIASLVVSTGIGLLGGYALARLDFRGKKVFLVTMLCTQFVPGAMMLIPLFQIFTRCGSSNSLWSLVIADTVFHLPLSSS